LALTAITLSGQRSSAQPERAFQTAGTNGRQVEEVYRRAHKMAMGWLAHADQGTLLLQKLMSPSSGHELSRAD